MSYQIIQGNSSEELKKIPENYFHCVITSPPYFGLRDYHISGQFGLEKTVDEYISSLLSVFEQVYRVLRKDGTFWLNVGDSYARVQDGFIKPKDMCGIPWRLSLKLQEYGWYLRSICPWVKRNALPTSVTDRPSSSLEFVLLLSKSEKYFYDVFSVKKDNEDGTKGRNLRNGDWWLDSMAIDTEGLPLGFDVPTQSSGALHFATFPIKLIEPMVRASTSEYGCCAQCGTPYKRKYLGTHKKADIMPKGTWEQDAERMGIVGSGGTGGRLRIGLDRKSPEEKSPKYITTNWENGCECNSSVVPCKILDPFSGSSTTGVVAQSFGRDYVGIELNPEYVEISRGRLK